MFVCPRNNLKGFSPKCPRWLWEFGHPETDVPWAVTLVKCRFWTVRALMGAARPCASPGG